MAEAGPRRGVAAVPGPVPGLEHGRRTRTGAGGVWGAVFGPAPGAALPLVALTITAGAQFLFARRVAGERVRQRVGQASVRVSRLLERRGAMAVAGARLLPAPFSEFNMLAGLTSLNLRDFMIGTVI